MEPWYLCIWEKHGFWVHYGQTAYNLSAKGFMPYAWWLMHVLKLLIPIFTLCMLKKVKCYCVRYYLMKSMDFLYLIRKTREHKGIFGVGNFKSSQSNWWWMEASWSASFAITFLLWVTIFSYVMRLQYGTLKFQPRDETSIILRLCDQYQGQ